MFQNPDEILISLNNKSSITPAFYFLSIFGIILIKK